MAAPHRTPAPRPIWFAGSHYTWPYQSKLIARCALCDAPIYIRVNSDAAELAIEHSGGACANWTEGGELRVAKVHP